MCLPPEVAFKEKKPFFKPRIRKEPGDAFRWECVGKGWIGVGDTPTQAYRAWWRCIYMPWLENPG